jgi:maleate cis-trans isomerase
MTNLDRMMPRFRWGTVSPTALGNRVRRGPGYQFYKIVPNDVMEFAAGKGIEEELEVGNVDQAVANYWEAVDLLAKEQVDVIILGGAPVSANFGRAKVLELIQQTKEKTGIPVTTPLESFLAGMHHLGLKTVTIGSRWGDQLNKLLAQYLSDGGIDAVGTTTRSQTVEIAHGMSFEEGLETALNVGREAALATPSADAVFVPGGAAMSLHAIPAIEEEFKKPVLTNLSAEVWEVLVKPRVIPPVEGWGRLLGTP